jgi:xanthine dehydrogenase accessory factor
MDERLFATLATKLAGEAPPGARRSREGGNPGAEPPGAPHLDSRLRGNDGRMTRGRVGQDVVLACVVSARGATPRKAGSRMLVGANWTQASVGGGAMEARVVEAARALLRGERDDADVEIDLTGRPGAAGVCGGAMRVALSRWLAEMAPVAQGISAALARGERVAVDALAASIGGLAPLAGETLHPDPRLLIVGGGHCALALHELARHLDFEAWVFDERDECFTGGAFEGATTRSGDPAQLAQAFDTQRDVLAVLLNRDFASDVAALRVLGGKPLAYLGMMGSRKRIGEVRAALPGMELPGLVAPVGIEIGAETPHEIAVSILAQLIAVRRHA